MPLRNRSPDNLWSDFIIHMNFASDAKIRQVQNLKRQLQF